MKVAVFGAKFEFEQDTFIKQITEICKKERVKDLDLDYNSTSCEQDKEDLKEFYLRMEKSLKACDVAIFENSINSDGVGFLVGRALGLNKKVLVLIDPTKKDPAKNNINKSFSNVLLAFLHHYNYEYKIYSPDSLPNIIHEFFEEYIKLGDTKFMLRLSPDLLGYLNSQSQELGQSKAEIIRKLLEKERQES